MTGLWLGTLDIIRPLKESEQTSIGLVSGHSSDLTLGNAMFVDMLKEKTQL